MYQAGDGCYFPVRFPGRTCLSYTEHMSAMVDNFINIIYQLIFSIPILLKYALRKSSVIKNSVVLLWFELVEYISKDHHIIP